jgi:hypothetical protein
VFGSSAVSLLLGLNSSSRTGFNVCIALSGGYVLLRDYKKCEVADQSLVAYILLVIVYRSRVLLSIRGFVFGVAFVSNTAY